MLRWTPPAAIDVRRWTGRIARRLSGERGFTLIELVVGMALSLFIGAAAMTFMIVTFDQQNTISSRTVATNQAAQGLEALVRDLREATTTSTSGLSISTSGSTTTVSFDIPAPGTGGASLDSIVWTCTDTTTTVGKCTRVLTPVAPLTGSTITKTEITGVQSLTVTPYNASNPPTSITLPISNATSVSAVAITLHVTITSYGLTYGTKTTAAPGDTNPIVLKATADLLNFA
jgi:prepilin-type N-terminal cleavage/methylation domain-containing protein